MEINIKDYLTDEDLRSIVEDEVRRHIRNVIGETSVSDDKSRVLLSKLAKNLAKDGVQEIIPNFRELINEHIVSEINKVTLQDFFMSSLGWKSEGNKILNAVLTDNKALLDAKIKELFQTIQH